MVSGESPPRCIRGAAKSDFVPNLSGANLTSAILRSTNLKDAILDDVIFIDKGQIVLTGSADKLRAKHKSSINDIFRSMFYAKKAN